MGVVVDASVCAKWFFDEENRAEAMRLLESGEELLAPDLLAAELGSVVLRRCAGAEITEAHGVRTLGAFRNIGIDLRPTAELGVDALRIGLALRHSLYDCLYLALAQRERLPLVTADRRLRARVNCTRYAGLTFWIADLP